MHRHPANIKPVQQAKAAVFGSPVHSTVAEISEENQQHAQASRIGSPSSSSRPAQLTNRRRCRPTHRLFSDCRSILLVAADLADNTFLAAADHSQAVRTAPVADRTVLGVGRMAPGLGHTGWARRHSNHSGVPESRRSRVPAAGMSLAVGRHRGGLAAGIEDRQVVHPWADPSLVSEMRKQARTHVHICSKPWCRYCGM